MKKILIALLALSLMLAVLGCVDTGSNVGDDSAYGNAMKIKDLDTDQAVYHCQNIKDDDLRVKCMNDIME